MHGCHRRREPRGRRRRGAGARCRLERINDAAGVVGEQQEDLAEVGARGAVQTQAVELRAGMRALVRKDDALREVGEAKPRDEAAARAFASIGPPVGLIDEVQTGRRLANQHAVGLPLLEGGGGASIGRILRHLARRDGEVEVDGVMWAAPAKLGGLRRRDHVVRRRHHLIERDGRVVADASERGDLCHVSFRRRARLALRPAPRRMRAARHTEAARAYWRMMTGMPTTTLEYRSSTSGMCMRMQPWEA